MANVFEGPVDGRQADTKIAVSRFRPRYRALDDSEKALHDEIKTAAAALETLFEKVPAGRELSIGFTKLEEAVMWAVKGLTK